MVSGEGIRSFIHKHSLSTSYKIIPEGDRKINYSPNIKYECPVCGGYNVNKLPSNFLYCLDCGCEIDQSGKAHTIQWDGTLIDYYENEFINCG